MIENGINRYTMASEELKSLYKRLENFVADCTTQEYLDNKEAINSVFSLIHKHQQRARKEKLVKLVQDSIKKDRDGQKLDVLICIHSNALCGSLAMT